MSAIYIEITATRGSSPRDAGTAMKVTADDITGTIGGGALEYQAIATAREMLATNGPETRRTIPLGPNLGQCCGGAVTLLFTRDIRQTDAPKPAVLDCPETHVPLPLWVWGAGHVGRAIVAAAVPTRAFAITWIDSAPGRFPDKVAPDVCVLPAADIPRAVPLAPRGAHHLILTYSHDIDLALCAALLRHGFASCGLIGSATKKARFDKRLSAMGLDPVPILCPIGDKTMGKHPDMIAAGTVRALLTHSGQKESA